jgi:DNA-binding NtrC family response regulator
MRQATQHSIPSGGIDLPQSVEGFERSFIDRALGQTGGNQTRAARLLGLRVQTLNMKLKRYAQKRGTA